VGDRQDLLPVDVNTFAVVLSIHQGRYSITSFVSSLTSASYGATLSESNEIPSHADRRGTRHMKGRYSRKLEWSIVVLIILSCSGIVWLPYKDADVKPWEQGRNVPKTSPSEDRRVYNPHHFSIVAPPRWEWDVDPPEPDPGYAYPSMRLHPRLSIPTRCASIYLAKLGEVPSVLDDCRKTDFQGEPAFVKIDTERGFDDPSSFHCVFYFQRSGAWYQLGYVGLLYQEELPPMVQQYFDTFRIEKPIQEEREMQTEVQSGSN